MTATKTVKVAEFRRLCSALSQAFASLRSAANESERVREAQWVRGVATELMGVTCPRASAYDRQHAETLIDITASWLIKHGLTATAR